MPAPTKSDVHVNKPLTQISEATLQDSASFISQGLWAPVGVENRSDVFFKYSAEDFNRDDFQLRAPGAESKVVGFGLSTDSYVCNVKSLAVDLDEQTLSNADAPLDLEGNATAMLMNKLLIHMEKDWTSNFFTTGKWTGAADGTSWDWSSASNDPINDIQALADGITGPRMNQVVMGKDAYRIFVNHPLVVDKIKYTQTGTVTQDLVAGLLGLDKVVVLDAFETTSSSTFEKIGGAAGKASVLLMHSAPTPSIMTPSAGYCFKWNRYLGGGAGQRVYRYEIPERRATRIEVEAAYTFKQVAPTLGAFQSAVTS